MGLEQAVMGEKYNTCEPAAGKKEIKTPRPFFKRLTDPDPNSVQWRR